MKKNASGAGSNTVDKGSKKKTYYVPTKWSVWKDLPKALPNDEAIKLIKEYQEFGDEKVRDKIILHNMRYITYWINAYGRSIINCVTPIYPSFEDLQQEAILIIMKAIDSFKPEYTFTFSTYFSHSMNSLKKIRRSTKAKKRDGIVVSLNETVKNGKRKADEEGSERIDGIADDRFSEDILHDKIELQFIQKEILPLLTKTERDMFQDALINEMKQDVLAEKYGVSQVQISRILAGIKDRICVMYLNGITDLDRALRGVRRSQNKRYIRNHLIINKYGKDFLEQYFLPTLAKNQREVFDKCVLRYYGQSTKELAKTVGMNEGYLTNMLLKLEKKLQEDAPRLQQMQKEGKLPKPRKLPLAVKQKINRNNRLMEEYGGKLFLAKYFLPILPDVEKRIFEAGVLEYNGESTSQLAKKCGVSDSNFSTKLPMILEKLKKTDFEVLVDLQDNAERFGGEISTVQPTKLDAIKERLLTVEKFGGKERLRQLFLPVLPEAQRRVLEDMYLTPKFDSFSSMANYYEMKVGPILVAEKTMLEKLSATDFKELERLQAKAQQQLELDQFDSYRFGRSDGIDIEKLGGVQFLKEVFGQNLQVNAHKIIFESYILDSKPIRDVLEELGLPPKAKDYVQKTSQTIIARLKYLKSQHKDYEQMVKDFYARKEFEKLHPEDFEKLALPVEEKPVPVVEEQIDLSNVGNVEIGAKRRAFMEEFIKQYGEKKELIQKFMPSLKKVVQQQVFLGCFLEGKLDAEVEKQYKLTTLELKDSKKVVLQALEKYKDGKEQKKQNDGRTRGKK